MNCNALNRFSSCQKKCLELGGNLASVHDPHTSGFLKTFLRKCASGMPRTWIGAHDAIQVAGHLFHLNLNPTSVGLMSKLEQTISVACSHLVKAGLHCPNKPAFQVQ